MRRAHSQPMTVASLGMPSVSSAESDFGARSMLVSIRSLAKNLRAVPGRKMLILFSAGFPLDPERMSELTATIDACNKANIAARFRTERVGNEFLLRQLRLM